MELELELKVELDLERKLELELDLIFGQNWLRSPFPQSNGLVPCPKLRDIIKQTINFGNETKPPTLGKWLNHELWEIYQTMNFRDQSINFGK